MDATVPAMSSAGFRHRILEASQKALLKIGQFSFSEQDLVVPVNGIPLTVARTFDATGNQSLPRYCLPICQRFNAPWCVTAVTAVTAPKQAPEKIFRPPSPHSSTSQRLKAPWRVTAVTVVTAPKWPPEKDFTLRRSRVQPSAIHH